MYLRSELPGCLLFFFLFSFFWFCFTLLAAFYTRFDRLFYAKYKRSNMPQEKKSDAHQWYEDSFDPSTAVYTPNSEAEKRLVRKIDMRIVRSAFYYFCRFSFDVFLNRFLRYSSYILSRIWTVPTSGTLKLVVWQLT